MPQSAHRFALATIFSAIAAIAPASDLGDRLDREIRGAWGILEVEVYSSCAGTYNDNTIGASGVASKAGRRFEPGELINASFSTYRSRASKDRPNHWRDGFDDGQKLIFNVLLADRLTACRVAVPPLDRQ